LADVGLGEASALIAAARGVANAVVWNWSSFGAFYPLLLLITLYEQTSDTINGLMIDDKKTIKAYFGYLEPET
jgi:hypothetical protein